MEAATPADRDRWVDTLRVGSLLVVVLGHWLMVALTPDGRITNALAVVPALQPLTWLLQVMPLFFLVGGVAHAHTLESLERRSPSGRGRYAAFFRRRATRLLRPTLAFLAVWVAIGVLADLSGLTSRPGDAGRLARDALVTVPQLLWFVGIYLGACAFAPLMRRLHRWWGLRVVAVLVALAVVVDVVRFGGGPELVGNLNFALVWLALHQLGFAWRDELLTTGRGWAMAVAGYGAMGLAVALGPYPTSMVGLPGEAVSNMAPPTAALLAQGVGICGLAVVLRPVMARVLSRPPVWRGVVVAGPFAMTAFLWHLTALMTVLLGMSALDVSQPPIASAAWWLSRPLLFAVLAAVTTVLVALFVRFDRAPRPEPAALEGRRWVDPLAAASAAVLFFGILMVSIVGVDVLGNRPVFFLVGDVTPVVGFAVLAIGLLLLRATRPRGPRID
ncbi:acyltransferase [Terrabacter sp. NPDC080008]|uniref:acyltransferase family protein n=1 Tax=Terrabacter sp. NPDC080008 TaxID=3155176 RepID=UPI003450774E